MSLNVDDIPDLPDYEPPKQGKARKSSPPAVVDGDTGELMLSPVQAVQQATAIVAQQGNLLSQVATETKGYNIATATPEARAALVDFYLVLREIADQLDVRARAIEFAWAGGLQDLHATRLPLPDGRTVELVSPSKTYRVEGPELRAALETFAREGLVSEEDAAAAVEVVVTYKPDHRVINKLDRTAPEIVREAIAAHRTEVPSLNGGRVRFPKPLK